MTAWARLTWQAVDPAALAADLERRLGPAAVARWGSGGERVFHFRGGDLHVVPWRHEAADDEPHRAGRLVFEPVDQGTDPSATDDGDPGSALVPLALLPFRLLGVGWATVELDRAEAELDPWLDPAPTGGPEGADGGAAEGAAAPDDPAPMGGPDVPAPMGGPDAPEPHLGARTRVRRSPGLPGEMLVLAEPATEGRLAASLARDGEGPCALYLEPVEGLHAWLSEAARRGVGAPSVRPGPLGPSVLLPGSPTGPHLVLVGHRDGSSPGAHGGTIRP